LFERFASPFALETFSCLTGAPLLVVDLRLPYATPSRNQTILAQKRLAQLPCPSVGIGDVGSEIQLLCDAFDVTLDDEKELDAIRATVEAAPLASMTLAQLLRHSEGLSVHEGLIAESLVYSTLQNGPEFQRWLATRDPAWRKPVLEPAVRVERVGNRLMLALNRPGKHNAFSAEMRDALFEALQVAASDPSVEEVLIRGEGASFCSGGDLDEFGTLPDPATAHAIRSTRNVGRLLASLADRVRFEIHGACIGAGMELPAFGKRVVAWEDAYFELPEVGLGLVPGAGGTVSIPRRIGRQRTAYLALSRARLDVATALRWGLIDEIKKKEA